MRYGTLEPAVSPPQSTRPSTSSRVALFALLSTVAIVAFFSPTFSPSAAVSVADMQAFARNTWAPGPHKAKHARERAEARAEAASHKERRRSTENSKAAKAAKATKSAAARDHTEYAVKSSPPGARNTRFQVEPDAMFDAQDEDHDVAHATQGVRSETTGLTSKGVVTLEGTWTQKQLDAFDALSLREQHEFFNHYKNRLNKHFKGESSGGGGKAKPPAGSNDAHYTSEAHCEASKKLRRCFLQTEEDCASPTPWGANLRCQWDAENAQCNPKDDTCATTSCACSGDGTGPPGCTEDCECKANVLCEWEEEHRRNDSTTHKNQGRGVRTKVHVGPTGEGGKGYNETGEEKSPGIGPKGYKVHKNFRFSRVCDMCELFGVDAEDCDTTNFRPYVEEQELVENGNAGFCGATLRTGDMCAIECARGYYPSSKISCDLAATGNGDEKAAVANCLNRSLEDDADMECQGPPTCIGSPCPIFPPENGNFGDCGLQDCESTFDHDEDVTTPEVPKHNNAEGCVFDPQKNLLASGASCTPGCAAGFHAEGTEDGAMGCTAGLGTNPTCVED